MQRRGFLALGGPGLAWAAGGGRRPADLCGCALAPQPAGSNAFEGLRSGVAISGLKVFGVSLTRDSDRPYVFVKIETDQGVVGWGEGTLEGKAGAVMACVNDFRDFLIGADPMQVEHLWQSMYVQSFYRAGPVEALHVHRLPEVLHLHGVRADQEIAEVVDAGHHRARFALQGSFAPSHHALVRFDLHEHVWAIRIAGQRDAEDFQAAECDPRAQPSKGVAAGRRRSQRAAAQVRGPAPAACRPSQAGTAQRQKSSTLHGISPEPLRSP